MLNLLMKKFGTPIAAGPGMASEVDGFERVGTPWPLRRSFPVTASRVPRLLRVVLVLARPAVCFAAGALQATAARTRAVVLAEPRAIFAPATRRLRVARLAALAGRAVHVRAAGVCGAPARPPSGCGSAVGCGVDAGAGCGVAAVPAGAAGAGAGAGTAAGGAGGAGVTAGAAGVVGRRLRRRGLADRGRCRRGLGVGFGRGVGGGGLGGGVRGRGGGGLGRRSLSRRGGDLRRRRADRLARDRGRVLGAGAHEAARQRAGDETRDAQRDRDPRAARALHGAGGLCLHVAVRPRLVGFSPGWAIGPAIGGGWRGLDRDSGCTECPSVRPVARAIGRLAAALRTFPGLAPLAAARPLGEGITL